MSTPKQTRGIRDNDPGNIRDSKTRWLGEVPADQEKDFVFEEFTAPVYGIRAIGRILLNYEKLYNLHTIHGLISRWAPPHENNTASYIRFVGLRAGVDPDTKIKVSDYLEPIVTAIIWQENSQCPYDASLIKQACDMARGLK